tara:strand:- start:147 stop:989 length:843 start_codon:yes stop_codon:yes gene_type:complete
MKHILNLGAGVQSSTLALMASHGEITPLPTCAIFADTKAESQEVYDWLDWLETKLAFPVYRVSKGDLTKDSLTPAKATAKAKNYKEGEEYMKRIIPLFGLMPNGEVAAALGRNCTADYKIRPIEKKIKQLAEIKRGEKEVKVIQWIGISYDEIQRMKESQLHWTKLRYPLIELEMHRHHCKEWMAKNGYPEPPRSACYYCPFHSDHEWRKLRDNDPEHFAKAIAFDKEIRELSKKDKVMKMEAFIHRSCKPLDEVDFDSDEDKGQLTWDFQADCSGMCGV